MAKVTEGDPYYYAPIMARQNSFSVHDKRNDTGDPVCYPTTQDNASLIVDALNFYQAYYVAPEIAPLSKARENGSS